MTTIEDELRAVLDGFSEHGAPAVDRTAAVQARIQHHQRVRVAGLAAALVIAIAVTGGILSTGWLHPTRHGAPPAAQVTAPSPKPGHVADYADGGKRTFSSTALMPVETTMSITFTPTSWDFFVADACQAPVRDSVAVYVNGHPLTTGDCTADGGAIVVQAGDWDNHQQFWSALGVTLGAPVTVTAEIGQTVNHDSTRIVANSDSGIASIGVYTPVPWDDYHFPAKPAHPGMLGGMSVRLPETLTTLSDDVMSASITLPSRIEVTATAIAPGQISVYLNGYKIDECDSWTYQDGCADGLQEVGKGRLAGFSVGQRVIVTVKVERFTGPMQWQMTLAGQP